MLPLPRTVLVLVAALAALAVTPGAVGASAGGQRPSVTVSAVGGSEITAAVRLYCRTYPPVVSAEGSISAATCVRRTGRAVPSITHRGALRLRFDRPGWRWKARYESTGTSSRACRATRTMRTLREGVFRLPRPPHPGTYRVTLVGRGAEGRVVAAITWRYGTGRCS
ncbi:hypothetical protein FHP29_12260 [Nocardioides albidus]|uniref:Secreted protein n=1 Tax=Nocardioides albidus TaxID=1517589 RepID=A0A5C4VWR1_9ACTN|nr:hypothetical protein [Nocardioides albidus]TNM39639.1 hypothetical protein FHP29_12260 [Nocardioides albidus]